MPSDSIDNSEESVFWSKLQFEKYKGRFHGLVGDVCNAEDFRAEIENADICIFLAASKHVDLAEDNLYMQTGSTSTALPHAPNS